EDEVVSSWARLPGTSTVLVAIARRAAIERYSEAFAEAGVKIGCFTCSAAAIYSALRLASATPAAALLAAEPVDGHVEYYGESPSRPLFSASFDAAEPRAGAFAAAELRIDPSTDVRPLDQLLSASPGMPFAAAVASACSRLSLPVNLLPVELRQNNARILWVPSAIAASMVLIAATALAAVPAYQNHRYETSLQSEIRKYQ